MRLTKRKNGYTYFNPAAFKDCGGAKLSYCKYSNRCKRAFDRTCPYLMLLDKLADFEDSNPDKIILRDFVEQLTHRAAF